MIPSFNANILKHTAVAGHAMNNLINILHVVESEGNYTGTIFQNEKVYAMFTIHCNKEEKNTLLHVDLSLFDPLHAVSLKQLQYKQPLFHIQQKGVLLFHTSGLHNNFYIVITKNTKQGEQKELEFDSRKLSKKDKAAIRLFQFGEYILINELNKETMNIEVVKNSLDKYDKSGSLPVSISYTGNRFEPQTIQLHVGQLLLIDSKDEIAIVVKNLNNKN